MTTDDVTVTHYSSVDQIPPGDWTAATSESLWSSLGWLRSVEGKFSQQQAYFIAHRSDRPTGAMATYATAEKTYANFNPDVVLRSDRFDAELAPYCTPDEAAQLERLRSALTRPAVPAAVCVVPFGFVDALWASDATSGARLLDELADVGREWAGGASSVMLVDASRTELRGELRRRGYLEQLAAANAVVDIDSPSLEGYLMTLRGVNYKDDMRRFRKSGISVRLGDVGGHLELMAELIARSQERHGHGYDVGYQRKALEGMNEFLRDHLGVLLAERDGALVGFQVLFQKGPTVYPKMFAFDEQKVETKDALYFNLTYYEVVRHALAIGARQIEYGIDAYQAKTNRGAQLRRLFSYLKVPGSEQPEATELARLRTEVRERYFSSIERARDVPASN